MKAHVFISVLAFHVVVIAGLYLLSACSSSSSNRGPTPDQTVAPSRGGSIYNQYAEPNRPRQDEGMVVTETSAPSANRSLDPAFNSGSNRLSDSSANRDSGRYQPTRPSSTDSVAPIDTPALNEFPEEAVLQPLTSATPAGPAIEYEVKKGDSPWKISRQFDVPLKDLLAANNLTESSPIQIGQKLIIPTGETAATTPTGSSPSPAGSTAPVRQDTYVVVSGDTLSRIAKQFNSTVNDIKAANGLQSDIIQLGQQLTIPVNSASATRSSTPPAVAPAPVASAPSSASAPVSDEADIVHTVEAGETPGGIAKMYGITTAQLMEDNGISDPRKIRVGQTLNIRLGTALPATTTPPSSTPDRQVTTPTTFDDSLFDDLEDIPEVEVVPRS